jgi:AcrR family transcriptional regulator
MNKKESILHEAMILFAERGLFGVSTQQIAKQAKVSEGLIFKHYGSKEGLLQAVFSNGHACVQSLMTKVAQLSTAKEKLNALLDFPLIMMKEKPNFWKLSFTIKLQHPDLYMRLQPTTDSPDITEFLHSVLLQL